MLKIGDKTAEDTIEGRLAACHDRLRRFAALAVKIAAVDAPASEIADAAVNVHRYFTVALPLHHADEELSIATRVAVPEIAEMRDQHVAMDAILARLVPAWAELARSSGSAAATRADAETLAKLLDAHLQLEERYVFPRLLDLSAAQRDAVLTEMSARRQ